MTAPDTTGGPDGDQRSWLDVDAPAAGNGTGGNGAPVAAAAAPAQSLDTSSWFDSNLPPAAEQPEAKISLSSIGVEPSLPSAAPPRPSLSEATEEVRSTPPQIGGGGEAPDQQ